LSAIAADRLTKSFGETKAVDDLSFDVERGSVHALVGPNGSGKTTTLRMMVGLLRPDSGSVRLFGEPLTGSRRRGVLAGYLPSDPRFPGHLTGLELMNFYARFYGRAFQADSAVQGVLESVGLVEESGKRIRSYSKGMVRRLGLAQALIGDPALLLLDEPSVGLDPLGMIQFYDLLPRLAKKGKTVLISTHLLSEVERLCDSVTILNHGRAVVSGSLERLSVLTGTSTLDLELAEVGENVVRAIRTLPFVDGLRLEGKKIKIHLSTIEDRRLELSKAVVSAGGTILSFEASGGSMEDVFLRYVMGNAGTPRTVSSKSDGSHDAGRLLAVVNVPSEARVGDDVTIELCVTNTGEAPVRPVKVEEAIPDGTALREGPSSFDFDRRELRLESEELGPLESKTTRLTFRPDEVGSVVASPKVFYLNSLGEMRVIVADPASVRIAKDDRITLGTRESSKVLEYLKVEFVRDNLDLNLNKESSGWRSLIQIARGTGLSTSSLYGRNHNFGPAIGELLSNGVIESKTFLKQRGRGGEAVKVRVRQDLGVIRRGFEGGSRRNAEVAHGQLPSAGQSEVPPA
jgi:ABC-2 type transport system ATP-binding protein